MEKVKIAILGLGGRGRNTYGRMMSRIDNAEIVAIADTKEDTLKATAEEFGISKENCYSSAEELLSKPRLADILIIGTPDNQHCAQAVKGLELGYHLLLEKPIATTKEDCLKILEAQKKYGKFVVVCHVLRYTPFYNKIREIIDSGIIGDIVTLNASERVVYWHQAHSFVRGNWRNTKEQAPMILAKSCHDMDIIRFMIGKKCLSVSSYGSLTYFKGKNAPEGAADRCRDCKVEGCLYNAYDFYLPLIHEDATWWPANILSPTPDREHILEAIDNGPYGRCVYKCDNDVVDHQVVNLLFEDGVTANFTMTAFTATDGRTVVINGTKGEIRADMNTNLITVLPFDKDTVTYDINKLADDLSGHAGGDIVMFRELINSVATGTPPSVTLDEAMESHFIAFAAEESRVNNGKPFIPEQYK